MSSAFKPHYTTPLSMDTEVFSFSGLVKPTVGIARWYPYRISNVVDFYATIEYPPLAPVVLQLNLNGSPIGDQITIQPNEYKSDSVSIGSRVTPNDYLTVDIVSGSNGANVYACLVSSSMPDTTSKSIQLSLASTNSYGAVKIGDGLTLNENNALSALPQTSIATTDTAGIVSVGEGLKVSPTGVLALDRATIQSNIYVFKAGIPQPNEVLYKWVVPSNMSFNGVLIDWDTQPTAEYVIHVLINGSEVGTITSTYQGNAGTNSIYQYFLNGQLNQNDVVVVQAHSALDTTASGLALTFQLH